MLEEFLRHLELERGRSPHTLRAYRGDVSGLLASLGPDAELAALDLPALRRWLAADHARGVGRATLARRAAAARTFTAWAQRSGRLADDPGARLAAPRRAGGPAGCPRRRAGAGGARRRGLGRRRGRAGGPA